MALKDRIIEIAYKLKDQFTGGVGKITGSFKKVESASDRAAAKVEKNNKRSAGSFLSLANAVRGFAALGIAKFFGDATIGTESLLKGLEAVTGSTEQAAEEFDFIKRTANDMGVSVRSAGKAYLDLAAAAKGTNLEGQQIRDVFTAITRAMGKLGKSSADTEGALRAVSQMISKGKVSAEELRQQLGERLPGAFQLAAKAIGVTTAELDDMLKAGELTADDLLPKLADQLNQTFDNGEKINTFAAIWARFVNSLEGSVNAINNSTGVMNGLGRALSYVGSLVSVVTVGFITVQEHINSAATKMKAFFDFVSRDIGLLEFRKRVDEATKTAEENIAKAADAAFSMDENLSATAESAKKTAEETGRIDGAAKKAADAFKYIRRSSELTKTEISALNKQATSLDSTLNKSVSTYDRNVAALDRAKKSAKELKEEFSDLTKEMRSSAEEAGSLTVLDVQDEITKATAALNQGDEEGALKGARKAGELLRQMKEEGSEADIVLVGMAKRLETLAGGIAEASTKDELIAADKSKAALDELIAKKQKLVEGPLNLTLSIDSSALDNYKPQEIIIPVRYVAVNAPPTASGTSKAIEDAARKRGKI